MQILSLPFCLSKSGERRGTTPSAQVDYLSVRKRSRRPLERAYSTNLAVDVTVPFDVIRTTVCPSDAPFCPARTRSLPAPPSRAWTRPPSAFPLRYHTTLPVPAHHWPVPQSARRLRKNSVSGPAFAQDIPQYVSPPTGARNFLHSHR